MIDTPIQRAHAPQIQLYPRESVFMPDRRATVLRLDTFLKGQVHDGEFFEENYFTLAGMGI